MSFEENHSRIRKKWATKHGPHQAYGFGPFAANQSSDETTIPQTITQNAGWDSDIWSRILSQKFS